MYQMREIRAGKGASAVLEKVMFGRRRSGREPGRWASSRPVSGFCSENCAIFVDVYVPSPESLVNGRG